MAEPDKDAWGPPRKPLDAYIQRIGQRKRPFSDLYAFLLRSSWLSVLAVAGAAYLAVNAIFAGLYIIVPDAIANSDGSYGDAFFFSVQTFGAVGYGHMYPNHHWADFVMVVEGFVSMLAIALLTGIVFAKFARPHARVLFSKVAVVEMRDGVPTLSFRLANERGNDVVEASLVVSALKTYTTSEGEQMRRFFDLKLERSSSPIFLLTWQAFHRIDEDSPIYGLTPKDLVEGDVRLIVSVTGLDGTFGQTIHARHMYWSEEIQFGRRFVDVIKPLDDGLIRMDYRLFHLTKEDPTFTLKSTVNSTQR